MKLEPIVLNSIDEVKMLTGADGSLQYVTYRGENYVFRTDLFELCGYSRSSGSLSDSMSPDNEVSVIREYVSNPVMRHIKAINEAGIEEFMTNGRKNRVQRQRVCKWILHKLYGHKPPAPEPVNLTPAQIDEIADRVLEKFMSKFAKA